MAKNLLYIIIILLCAGAVRAQNPIFGSSVTLSGDSGLVFPYNTFTILYDTNTWGNDTVTLSSVRGTSGQVLATDGAGHWYFKTVSAGGLSQIYGQSPISIGGTDTVKISNVVVTNPASTAANTIQPTGNYIALTLKQPASFSTDALEFDDGLGGTHTLFNSSGLVPPGAGGTGLATLMAHAVIIGNGSSVPNFVAPSTSGNILKSNGTDWISSAFPSFIDSSRASYKSDSTGKILAANISGTIGNSQLTNSAVTVTAGTGLSGGGSVSLGGSVTLNLTMPVTVANGGTGTSSTSQSFVFAGPTSGSGAPAFRALVSGDIPSGAYLSSTLPDTGFANGIGTAKTPGFVLANTIASSVGTTVQAPPPLFWDFHQRSTTPTAADSERLWRIVPVPTSGLNPPSTPLVISFGNSNIGYSDMFSLSSTGKLIFPTGITNGGFAYFDHTDHHLEVGSFGGNQVPYFNALSSPFTCTNDFTFNAGTLGVGHASTSTGKINLSGTTSGTISLTVLAAAGTLTDTLIKDAGAIATASRAANGTMGAGTLAGGTATVNTTSVTATSMIFLTDAGGGIAANIGSLEVGTITAGTSFVVNSSNALDTSNFNWWIINP